MDDLIFYGSIALAVFVAVLLAVVVSQRERMKRFEAKVGVGGVGAPRRSVWTRLG